MNAPLGPLKNPTATELQAHYRRELFRAKIAAAAAALEARKNAPAAIPSEAMPAETDPPAIACFPVIPEVFAGVEPISFSSEPAIDDILRAVAQAYGIRVLDMKSARRTAPIVLPRQIAMYLCRQLTRHSLPVIGRHLGGRDHTTVLHACQKIGRALAHDPELAAQIVGLSAALTGEAA